MIEREVGADSFRADLVSSGMRRFGWWESFKNPVLRFQYLLRGYEGCLRLGTGAVNRIRGLYYRMRLHRLSYRLGISIPPNVFGPGLCIVHHHGIVVSAQARIGRNCRIHAGVNIGAWKGGAPVIGDNVYLGPGAKLIGGIRVGDGVVVGANAVVCDDVPPRVTVGGVPAKVISPADSSSVITGKSLPGSGPR